MRKALIAFILCLAAVAPRSAAAAQDAPKGWRAEQTAEGVNIYTPPDLKPGEVFSVAVYPEQPLEGKALEEWLRLAIPIEPALPGVLITHGVELKTPEFAAGVAGFTAPGGVQLMALYTAISLDKQIVRVVRIVSDPRAPLFARYKAQTGGITGAIIAAARRQKDAHGSTPEAAAGTARPRAERSAAAEQPAVTGATTKTALHRSAASTPAGPLPAASIGAAQVFIKYRWSYGSSIETHFDHLLLFPDGTAFDDIPSKPLASFDPATLRAHLKPWNIGRWEKQGDAIILSFPDKEREPRRVLRKHRKGWSEEGAKADSSYDIYFPVIPISKQLITGAWRNKSLVTTGFAGGGMPMVTAGSTSDFFIKPDGTFSNSRDSFVGATNANMGDAFKGDTTFGAYHENNRNAAGRWRLDDLLLTMEKDGTRAVHLAFVLPNWSSDGSTDLMVGGDRWERPENK